MSVAQGQNEPSGRRLRPISIVPRFRRNQDGATAVEFGLIAMPFIFTLLATMEVAMIMWQDELLQTTVTKVSRQIYTGELQGKYSASPSKADIEKIRTDLKKEICSESAGLIPCDTTFDIDVKEIASFDDAPPDPIKDKKYEPKYDYESVGARKIGLVTVSFEYKTLFPPLSGTKLANGNRVIMATAAFRVEPYGK